MDEDVAFARDIRPLFSNRDVSSMSRYFDLSSYDDVRANAERIYRRLADGTMRGDAVDIDANAPVITRDEIRIDAPPEVIWNIQTNISAWPQWQPEVDTAQLDGALTVGSVFHWETAGLQITSTVQEVDPPRRTCGQVPRRASPRSTCGSSPQPTTGCSSTPRSHGTARSCAPRPRPCNRPWTVPSGPGLPTSSTPPSRRDADGPVLTHVAHPLP
jgi:Polyketide cyclase / dehydrase and lipid transport